MTPWTATRQTSQSFTISWSLLNSSPLNRWCHATVSTSVAPISCSQSFPASGSLPVSWLFASGDQSIGASTSASVPPVNIQDWFPLGLTDLISLLSKGLSRVFSSATVWKPQFESLMLSLLYVHLSHQYITTEKTISLIIGPLLAKWCLCSSNMLSRFVIAFLPRSMAAVTVCSYLGAHENKISHCFHFFPIYLPWSDRTGCQNL